MTAGSEGVRPRPRVRAHDVVGVPLLPPGRATTIVDRARDALLRARRALTPPPLQIVDAMLASLDTTVLGALCALDVPEHLTGRVTIGELASRTAVDADVLERLIRYGATRGWVRIDRGGRVHPTRSTRFLRRSHPGGWRGWVDFAAGPEVLGALRALAGDPRQPDAFASANGAPFFEWHDTHPARHAAFDAAMAAGARLHGLALASSVDWSHARLVCDVGGGTGELLRTLVERVPHLAGVVLDLASVVARAEPSDRVRFVAGDARVAVPVGCDVYLFVNVVHDWDDDTAAQMLAGAAAARAEGGLVVVVEGERRRRPYDSVALRSDVLMLALTAGGRERTTADIAALASRAGLRLERAVPLASGDFAHVLA